MLRLAFIQYVFTEIGAAFTAVAFPAVVGNVGGYKLHVVLEL